MTQLELPPISFARYLDLLKRRRWSVLPVSLTGLLIGGLIAFFIPRYYVCQTVMKFEGTVLGASGKGRDPMKRVVAVAQTSIGFAVEDAAKKLGWPEVTTGSKADQRGFVADTRSRVKVLDMGPREPGRDTALVKISYRDTNGRRAVELANTLREVWIEGELKKLNDKANRELAMVKREIRIASETLDNAENEQVQFERNNGLNPEDFVGQRNDLNSMRSRQKEVAEGKIAERQLERQRLLAAIAAKRKKLDKTPDTAFVSPEGTTRALLKKVDELKAQVVTLQAALSRLTTSHPKYEQYAGVVAAAQAELEALEGQLGPADRFEKPNPDYVLLQEGIEKDQRALTLIEGELKNHRERVISLRAQIKRMPGMLARYAALKRDVRNAEADLDQFRAESRAKEANRRALTEQEAYSMIEEARPAPRPTEPNITLVALAGSALGLALAIGLILLLDLVQTTFKTLDDVERLLPLPVLGGMSHMVTTEQRRDATVRRTRVGLVAGVFLMLMITVITIYYVAPTRLPPVVRDTLGLILGSSSEPARGPK